MALRFINGEIVDDEAPIMSEDPSLAMSFDPSFEKQRVTPTYAPSPIMQKFAPFKYNPIDIDSINFDPQKEALQSRIDASRLRADDALQATVQRGRIDPQTAILDSLVSIAPSLIAGVITGGKHMDVLAGAVSDSLGRFGKIQDAEALAAQKAAAEQYSLESGIMKNDMSRLGQLEQQEAIQQMNAIQENNRNRFETDKTNFTEQQKTERTNLLANRQAKEEEIISDKEAELLAQARGLPLDTYKGVPRKTAFEAGKDTRLDRNIDQRNIDRGRKDDAVTIYGVEPLNPNVLPKRLTETETVSLTDKIANTKSLNAKIQEFDDLVASGGNDLLGIDSAKLAALSSDIINTLRQRTNSGANLTGMEEQLLQAVSPIAAARNPIEALKRNITGRDGQEFGSFLRSMNNKNMQAELAARGLRHPDFDAATQPSMNKTAPPPEGQLTREQKIEKLKNRFK